MRILRWVLLILYVALVIGLGVLSVSPGSEIGLAISFAVAVIGLAVFILGAGRKDLCRPIRRPRLVLPVAAAAFMMAVLVGLFWLCREEWTVSALLVFPGGVLLFVLLLFFARRPPMDRDDQST